MKNKIIIVYFLALSCQSISCSESVVDSLRMLTGSLNDFAYVLNMAPEINENTQRIINLFNASSEEKRKNILEYLNNPIDTTHSLLSSSEKKIIKSAHKAAKDSTALLLIDMLPEVKEIRELPTTILPAVAHYIDNTSPQLSTETLKALEDHALDQQSLDTLKNTLDNSAKNQLSKSLIDESNTLDSSSEIPAPPLEGPPPPSSKTNPQKSTDKVSDLTAIQKDDSDKVALLALNELLYCSANNLKDLFVSQEALIKAFLKNRYLSYKKNINVVNTLFNNLLNQIPTLLNQKTLEEWYQLLQSQEQNILLDAYRNAFLLLFFDDQMIKLEDQLIRDIVLHAISAWRIQNTIARSVSTKKKSDSDQQFFTAFKEIPKETIQNLSILRVNPRYGKYKEVNEEFNMYSVQMKKVVAVANNEKPLNAITQELKQKNNKANETGNCGLLIKKIKEAAIIDIFNQSKCLERYLYYPENPKTKIIIERLSKLTFPAEQKETDQKEDLYLLWQNSKNKLMYKEFIEKSLSATDYFSNNLAEWLMVIVKPKSVEQHNDDLYIEISSNKFLFNASKSQRIIVKLPSTLVQHYQRTIDAIKQLFKKKYIKEVINPIDINQIIFKRCLIFIEQSTTPQITISKEIKDTLKKTIKTIDTMRLITTTFLDAIKRERESRKSGMITHQTANTPFNQFIEKIAVPELSNQHTITFLNDVYTPSHTPSSISKATKVFISSWGIVLGNQQLLDMQASITYSLQSKLYGSLIKNIDVFVQTVKKNGNTSLLTLIQSIQQTMLVLKNVTNEDDKKRNEPIVASLKTIVDYLDVVNSKDFDLSKFFKELINISFEDTSLPKNQPLYEENKKAFVDYVNEITPIIQRGSIIMLTEHFKRFTSLIEQSIYHIGDEALPGLEIDRQLSDRQANSLEKCYTIIKNLIQQVYLPKIEAIKDSNDKLDAQSVANMIERISQLSSVPNLNNSASNQIYGDFYRKLLNSIKNIQHKNAVISYVNFLNKNINNITLNNDQQNVNDK